jgi:Helicase
MTDIALITDNLAAFADAIDTPLTDWQVDALRLEQRITAIVAPRQSGKSRSLAVLALWWAFRHREQKVLVVSAGEEASRRLLSAIRAIVSASPILRDSAVDEQAGLLTLVNGSEIRSVPASERQVRGWSVDLLLVDEAALVPDDLLLGAAFPTTAARPDAKIVLASSATSATGAFYDHAIRGEAGSEHVRTFRWQLAYATWISPSVIAAARDSMTEMRFNAEYMGVFASGQDALFTRQAIERVLCDRILHPIDALAGPARVNAGVDWGSSNDRSVFAAIGRVPNTSVFAVVTAHRWLAGAPFSEVTRQIVNTPAHIQTLTLEANGLGLPLCQEVIRLWRERDRFAGGGTAGRYKVVSGVDFFSGGSGRKKYKTPPSPTRPREFTTLKHPYTVTAASKAATYSALRLLVDKQQLLIPRGAEDLVRELLILRVDLSPSGNERIEASSGHDDLADGLAMALGPFQLQNKEWRTEITRLSEKDPIPSAEGVCEDDPSAFQSVGGRDVSAISLPVPTAQPVNIERHGDFIIKR